MFNNIPQVTKNLLLINGLVYLAIYFMEMTSNNFSGILALHYFEMPFFHWWQLLTYQFVHASFSHLFFNMFALWMFGCVLERVWGAQRYLIYYLVCGIGAGLCQELVQYLAGEYAPTVGASGAIYGILLAFGMTFPNDRIFLFPIPIPIKAKWFVLGYAAIELFSGFFSSGNVAHFAHLGGMLFGFLLIMYWRNNGYEKFNFSSGRQFFDQMRNSYERRRSTTGYGGNSAGNYKTNAQHTSQRTATRETDMEYNARKQKLQEEIDTILDKIRKSGYDSLTKEEKKRLFEASREK